MENGMNVPVGCCVWRFETKNLMRKEEREKGKEEGRRRIECGGVGVGKRHCRELSCIHPHTKQHPRPHYSYFYTPFIFAFLTLSFN